MAFCQNWLFSDHFHLQEPFEIKCRVLLCCAVIHANCHRFDVICTVGLYCEKYSDLTCSFGRLSDLSYEWQIGLFNFHWLRKMSVVLACRSEWALLAAEQCWRCMNNFELLTTVWVMKWMKDVRCFLRSESRLLSYRLALRLIGSYCCCTVCSVLAGVLCGQ